MPRNADTCSHRKYRGGINDDIEKLTTDRRIMINFGLHFSCSSLEGGDWPDLYEQAIEQTVLAESLGFTYAVVAEHHFTDNGWIPAPTILAAAFAGATQRIQVGTDIIVAPLHHPIKIAEEMLVLDNLSRGRAVCGLGLGAGENEFDAYGVPFKQRVSRTEETMGLLRELMTGAPTSSRGRYHTFDDVKITPPPIRSPRPPLLYGAQSVPGAQRAARLSDKMVIAPHVPIENLPLIRGAYDEEMGLLGRPIPEVIIRRELFTYSDSKDREVGESALKHQYSRVYKHVSTNASDSDFERFFKERFVIGNAEEAAEQLFPFIEAANCDTVIFRIQVPGLPVGLIEEAIQILGTEILPTVRKADTRVATS